MPYKDPEKQRAQHRKFYRRHRIRLIAKYREQKSLYWHAWAKANPAKLKASRDASRKRTRVNRRHLDDIRRAVKRGCTVKPKHILQYVRIIRGKRRVRCYYCDRILSGKCAQIDHVQALGGKVPGAHEIGNLCVSCADCNRSKHHKSISEWKRNGQQILPL